MSELRSLEEYVNGPEGNADQAFPGALTRAYEAIGAQDERVQIEVRITPAGEPSRQEGTWSVRVGDDPQAVADRLLERLIDSPGEPFTGEIRANFRIPGNTRAHLGSYTRKIRAFVIKAPDGTAAEEAAGTGEGSPGYWERVARQQAAAQQAFTAQLTALATGCATMMHGASTLIVNHARAMGRNVDPVAGSSPAQGGMIHDLLRGVLKVGAAAADGTPAGKAAAVAAAALDATAEPDPNVDGGQGIVPTLMVEQPSGGATPADRPASASAEITPEMAEAWARANPGHARAMAMKLMQEGV